jgi:hypothetical protein
MTLRRKRNDAAKDSSSPFYTLPLHRGSNGYIHYTLGKGAGKVVQVVNFGVDKVFITRA